MREILIATQLLALSWLFSSPLAAEHEHPAKTAPGVRLGHESELCRTEGTRTDDASTCLAPEDWAAIRDAREAARYAAVPVEDGHEALNSAQQLSILFDGRGFQVEPAEARWSWGLDLLQYGFGGSEVAVSRPRGARAEGGRVTYDWDGDLEEWYVNDQRGLEHGYTVRSRPAWSGNGGRGWLEFSLRIRGGLSPEPTPGGRGVHFLNREGRVALTYSGLVAFDATGRELEVSLGVAEDRLQLRVDERDARYPLTIDPRVTQAYLKASNTDMGDWFGSSLAVSGDTVVVGAYEEAGSATGVNGDDSDNSAWRAGAAYVFVRQGTSWTQQAYLKASNTEYEDLFGISVAVSGDTAVVGAIYEDSGVGGVNGDDGDNSVPGSGAAYVFVRQGTSWSQQAYLKAAYPDASDDLGRSVAISGDTIVVGASHEGSSATGVNGDQTDNSAHGAGAAYVFVREGTSWTQQAFLKASNTNLNDGFGFAVAVSGDLAVVGAPGEGSAATGVGGDQTNNDVWKAGAAYVFSRNGTTWQQEAYLKASSTDVDDMFGLSIALSGSTVLVGMDHEDSDATGVNGDPDDNGATDSGAAYLFARHGTSWVREAYLKASNSDTMDHFGRSVAISGNIAVVGAFFEDSCATGVNGDQDDNGCGFSGAAYVFVRNDTTWTQEQYLKAFNTEWGDYFGDSVAVSGSMAAIGAPLEDSRATGVNGDWTDNNAEASGAVYLHPLPESGVSYCSGDPGVGTPCPCGNDNDGSVPGSGCANGVFASGARLRAAGHPGISLDTLVMVATGLEPDETALFVQGNDQVNGGDGNIFGDGLRCVGGGMIRLEVRRSDGVGSACTSVAIAAAGGVSAGDTKHYQCLYRNPTGSPCATGFNLSNGYTILWIP